MGQLSGGEADALPSEIDIVDRKAESGIARRGGAEIFPSRDRLGRLAGD
jgi:hypothetical protein